MSVLVVDDDPALRVALERTLRVAGCTVTCTASVRDATQQLAEVPVDAVVCELSVVDGDVQPLVRWLLAYAPSTRIIVASKHITPEFRSVYQAAQGLRMVAKPYRSDQIAALLADLGPRRGFFGNAIEVELFDYVQMIALTARDKLIEVLTPRGVGKIWFEHGDIVHVEYDQFRGELAFYKLLAVGRGTFREAIAVPPGMRTVTRSSTHLLMEAARQSDEGTLGHGGTDDVILLSDEETSFGDLIEEGAGEVLEDPATRADAPSGPPPAPGRTGRRTPTAPNPPVVRSSEAPAPFLQPRASDNEHEDFAALVNDAIEEQSGPADSNVALQSQSGVDPGESQAAMSTVAGHAIFDDPDMRSVMLEQFWQFEGINGVAIISSTGKVLAEDMRSNSSLVTLAGFYMRGAARIARTLGHNVFDGVVARSLTGQQMVMVSMGAASAVLSVAGDADPDEVRDAVMGIE